jgi:hypothetical protein
MHGSYKRMPVFSSKKLISLSKGYTFTGLSPFLLIPADCIGLRRTIQRAAGWPAGPLPVGGATSGSGFRTGYRVAKCAVLYYIVKSKRKNQMNEGDSA